MRVLPRLSVSEEHAWYAEVVTDVLREIAERDGLTVEAIRFLSFHVTIERMPTHCAHAVRLQWLEGTRAMTYVVAEEAMADRDIAKGTTMAQMANLTMMGELHRFNLDRRFPKAIEKVDVQYDALEDVKYCIVHCKNGHVLRERESKVFSEEFLATLALVYDLPSR